MDSFFDFIERRKFGIMATFILHMAVFMYLQVETYTTKVYYSTNDVFVRMEQDDFIPINPDEVELPQDAQNWSGEVKNLTQDASDKRTKTMEGFSKTSIDSKVEQNVKDLERQFFEEFGSTRPSDNGKSSKESNSTNTNNSEKTSKSISSDKNTDTGGDGISSVYGGKTMVKYDLAGRHPHNKNDWYIRNPGYTCGSNSNGTVVVAIRVNQNGDVIAARYIPEQSSNANSCMVEKAQEYALKSRFAYKDSAPKSQDGFITYNFVSQ